MHTSAVRVLVVDDFEEWRRFVSTTVHEIIGIEVAGEAWDGMDAIQKARDLKPDLVLLDIGLPVVNGIEVARRIMTASSKPRIVFLTENQSYDVAEEALHAGASGYVIKSNARSELIPALKAVLEGKQFLSPNLAASTL